MVTPATMRRPCFIGEDDGLASIAEFSGNNNTTNINNNNNINFNNNNGYFVNQTHQNNNMPYMMRRRNSLRNITSLSTSTSSRAPPSAVSVSYSTSATVVSSPRSARLFDHRFEEVHSPHFLEACALCRKPLGGNRDIFMYRGDTPFCSEECRQEQIEIDEAKEKNWNLKALRNKKEAKKSASTTSSSSSKAQTYPFRTGTIAAA